MKTRQIGILAAILLIQITAVFAMPVIESFKIQFAFPDLVQVTWKVTDDKNLSRIEVYKDGKFVYDEDLAGASETSLFQTGDDNRTHSFEIRVYNILNEMTTMTKKGGGDRTPPTITSSITIFSSTKQLKFDTNEAATCRCGFSTSSLKDFEKAAATNHTAVLDFSEGSNKVLVLCSDDFGNQMAKAVTIDFTLDTIKPGTVTNLNYSVNDGKTRITWSAPGDSGIDHYLIYNSLKQLASVKTTYWDVSTNDSTYSISVVDKAGNEGDRIDYGLGRELLLKSDLPKATETPKEETKENPVKISTISLAAWSAFGVLIIALVVWKVYEHKSDKHGLRKYLRQRRKLREI